MACESVELYAGMLPEKHHLTFILTGYCQVVAEAAMTQGQRTRE